MIELKDKFNAEERSIRVGYYDYRLTSKEEKAQFDKENQIVIYACIACIVYLTTCLGACSPIHCRLSIALFGLICIALSVFAGFGISIMVGYEQTVAHRALPILMIGIGVDDMFIICNALD